MSNPYWLECLHWLERCNCSFRQCMEPSELPFILRDGSVLCGLLNKLCAGTVDTNSYSQRPRNCHFLIMKNIHKFLEVCSTKFGLKKTDLFDAEDLYEMKDFAKVMKTLSKLSHSSLARKAKIEGFEFRISISKEMCPDDKEENFQNDEEDNDDMYDSVMINTCKTLRFKMCRRPSVQEVITNKSSKQKCVDEIVDTEQTYVEVLRSLVENYCQPLKPFMPADQHSLVFLNIQKLYEIHKEFVRDLNATRADGTTRADGAIRLTLPECFINRKCQFVIYGDYCVNLPKAQETLQLLTANSPMIAKQIEECSRSAGGPFTLGQLLIVPFQRILKYHILLKSLLNSTNDNEPARRPLEMALDAMMDLTVYVNEVKRDSEALEAISDIQKSIFDMNLPEDTSIKDYGHLLKDGSLQVDEQSRYVFLFEKVMLICKVKESIFTYKDSVIVRDCKVTIKPNAKKSIFMTTHDSHTYKLKSKDCSSRNCWLEAIKLAMDNICPPSAVTPRHTFILKTFEQPTICDSCKKLLRGIFFQGYACDCIGCHLVLHKECLDKADETVPPVIPPRLRQSKSSEERCQVMYEYKAQDANQLTLTLGTMITLQERINSHWWFGKSGNQEGLFPASYVMVVKRNSYEDCKCSLQRDLGTIHEEHDDQNDEDKKDYENVPSPTIPLIDYDWYLGTMSKDEAVQCLEDQPRGTFLVRQGQELKVLSLKNKGVQHIRIKKKREQYTLDENKCFSTIPELIQYYKTQSLNESFDTVDTKLILPYKAAAKQQSAVSSQQQQQSTNHQNRQTAMRTSTGPVRHICRALYDYSASHMDRLTIHEGDCIEVISKKGESRGWWKGQLNGKIGFFPCAYVEDCVDTDQNYQNGHS